MQFDCGTRILRVISWGPFIYLTHLSRVTVFKKRDNQTLGNPQGCQPVAGRRSEAKPSGKTLDCHSHPGGVPDILHLFEVPNSFGIVIRWSATTGYYLAALRAAQSARLRNYEPDFTKRPI
jgi:hypothetical protein